MHVWMTVAALAGLSLSAPPKVIRLEAENGQKVGTAVATKRAGFSGSGYVTGFQKDGDKVVFTTQAQPGLYDVRVRYSSPFSEKGYVLVVNGAKLSGMFRHTGDVFATQAAGKVELRAGTNTLAMEKGWGYFDVDYIELVPANAPPKLHKPPKTPVDPLATARTRALLGSLVNQYGTKTLSGQYERKENALIHSATGKTPAIYGGDFMDYSPSRLAHGAKPEGTTEQILQQAKAGQIVTLSWHWNAPKDLLDKTYKDATGKTVEAPWFKGFYTYATTFDVQRALDHPESEDYRLLLRDIDAIAVQLKKFADSDVPLLWRPLHEAEGRWFWWGAKGSKPFIKLWRLLFDRLTHRHKLHNLIWVYTGTTPEWYPGDAYVDIVGIDSYPADTSDPLSSDWEALLKRYDGKKLLALTEFGGIPDVAKMQRYGVRWAYFVSWAGTVQTLPKDTLNRLYRSAAVSNQEDLARIVTHK